MYRKTRTSIWQPTRRQFFELDESRLKREHLIQLKSLYQECEQLKKSSSLDRKALEDIEKSFIVASDNKSCADEVESWLRQYQLEIETLIESYPTEREKVLNKELLQEFIAYLNEHNLRNEFENSNWYHNYESQKVSFSSQIQSLENKLVFLQSISVFTNINDPDSLAGWALENLELPLSIEFESALMYFQKLPKDKPKDIKGQRYIPFPYKLFDEFDIAESSNEGFWLNLDGVYEYIEKVEKPLFTTENVDSIKKQLQGLQTDIELEVSKTQQAILYANKLKNTLFNFQKLDSVIPLYRKKELFLNLVPFEYTLLPKEEFIRHISLFRAKEKVSEAYSAAQEVYDSSRTANNNLSTKVEEVNKLQNDLASCFGLTELTPAVIDTIINVAENSLKDKLSSCSLEVGESTISQEKDGQPLDLIQLVQIKSNINSKYQETKLAKDQAESNLSFGKETMESAYKAYRHEYGKEFEQPHQLHTIEDPDIVKEKSSFNQYKHAETAFKQQFDSVKELVEEKSQVGDYSVGELAHKLLPTVFKTTNLDESLIDESIAKRLDKLTEDIREISSRKHEILIRVITEVYDVYHQYIGKVADIDKYLKSHVITGGNKASLDYRHSPDFPDTWIKAFRKQLKDSLPIGDLFEALDEEVDINKMMIKTFKAMTGKPQIKVEPEDLLNPKSYFDLTFNLKLDSGKFNAGSNGQTYTANALLGLARLSLIEGKSAKGIKIMPIDEAEGLGSNYDLLHKLAESEGYQIISMSIETAGNIEEGEQNIFILSNGTTDTSSYIPPIGIFSDGRYVENIEEYNLQVVSQQ